MTNNDNLKDPLEELPNGLLSHALSFLPPASIAATTALSRRWRATTHSNSTLHREVDLSRWREGEMDVILLNFVRLSSLASNRLVKVSLNFQGFFNEWEDGTAEAFNTLFTHLQYSQQTLKEFSLTFASVKKADPLYFIYVIIVRLNYFTSLETVAIDAPVALLLTTLKTALPSSMNFSLTNSTRALFTQLEISVVLKILRYVKEITGTGFTHFSLLDGDSSDINLEILQELESSRLTMEHLDLTHLYTGSSSNDSNDSKLWEYASRCPNLISLRLWLSGWDRIEDQSVLEVPHPVTKCNNLKVLDLKIQGWPIDWSSLAKWAGNGLEKLKLTLDFNSSRRSELFSDGDHRSIILSSRKTLKTLDLRGIYAQVDFNETMANDFTFPQLESVSFDGLVESVFRAFSALESPVLHELSIMGQVSTSRAHKCLIKMLERHASRLVKLHLNIKDRLEPSLSDVGLKFDCLESMTLFGDNSCVSDLVSRSHFPNLVHLESSSQATVLFKKNAPNLEM